MPTARIIPYSITARGIKPPVRAPKLLSCAEAGFSDPADAKAAALLSGGASGDVPVKGPAAGSGRLLGTPRSLGTRGLSLQQQAARGSGTARAGGMEAKLGGQEGATTGPEAELEKRLPSPQGAESSLG